MKINDIKALAELVSKNNLSALEYSEGETHLRIENAPRTVTAAPAVEAAPVAAADAGADFNAAKMVTSPMVGVFYASPSPTDPPFVTVGSKVKKGDVLCIIEAMKLMNEITAEEDGEIIDICATNGSVVEYGQILFKML
ncbi:MAG TPA: acetyl-CoA carboxylase biotin carboxyl carrier protein [Candidatus Spyradocola merdavium]|nr:acetyl-CoA carboxylase biotin carboxyl carrier protein [Candidatus Spyradocola merdavium]